MKATKIFPLSALFISLTALPSLAGSSYVENSYNLRSTFNGRSTTNVNVNEVYQGTRSAGSDATRTETGTTTVTEANNGRTFNTTSPATVTNTSFARENGEFSKTTDVSVSESYDFTGFDTNQRATSGFDF